MPLKVIDKGDLNDLLRLLMADYEVVGVRRDNRLAFGQITEPEELFLDYGTTILPPKKYFFPPSETLFEFKLGDAPTLGKPADGPRRILFGVHPCDIHATWLLDAAMTKGNVDSSYVERRNNSIVIGMDCLKPCDDHAFCKSMGTHTATEGFDLMLTDVGDALIVEIGTPEGEGLLRKFAPAREISYNDRSKLKAVQKRKEESFVDRLDMPSSSLPQLLGDSEDSLLWDVLGDKCLSCGSCNLVCPTCYCFNVMDEIDLDLDEGSRYRQWDACVLKSFAEVAGGENFRKKAANRQRHRFFRKGKYLPEKFDKLGCVGCGRCSRSCLVHIDPVEVYNQLGGA